MTTKPITKQARQMVADEIRADGPQWSNLAGMVEGGFENLWLTPALRAVDRALDADREEDAP